MKRVWHYLLAEPFTWMFYAFFQPRRLQRELVAGNLGQRLIIMLRMIVPMVLVGLRVKEVANAKGISQSKLGRMADVDVKTMRRIYTNPTAPGTTTIILDRLAKALEVDASILIESIPDGKENAETN